MRATDRTEPALAEVTAIRPSPGPGFPVYSSAHFVLPLPDGHAFPMAKYARLEMRIGESRWAGLQLREPAPLDAQVFARVHCPDYVQRVFTGTLDAQQLRRIGFPWSPAMVERAQRVSGATFEALCEAVGGAQVAVSLAGGTHHAKYAGGAGYCVFNDTVVAIREAQRNGLVERVLVIDLDVHQGDGTAELCAHDPTIHCFSMHAARIYPAVKIASDLDVALDPGTTDADYLLKLASALEQLRARFMPDAVVYLAGADPFASDRLGGLALTKCGLARRDQLVLSHAEQLGLPVAITMAGGYAPDVDDIVDIHAETVRLAYQSYCRRHAGNPERPD